jgi:predicted solute-binding protein
VFAVWLAQSAVAAADIDFLNDVFSYGVAHIADVAAARQPHYPDVDTAQYLTQHIDYRLDGEKRRGMERFMGIM